MTEIAVTAYVDLAEFSDEYIQQECNARFITAELQEKIEEMYYAFKLGADVQAIAIAKHIAEDVTGRIL